MRVLPIAYWNVDEETCYYQKKKLKFCMSIYPFFLSSKTKALGFFSILFFPPPGIEPGPRE